VLNVLAIGSVKTDLDASLLQFERRRRERCSKSRPGRLMAQYEVSPLDCSSPRSSAPRWCRSVAGRCRWRTPGHARRAPGLPQRRRRVRRVAPGHRAGQGPDALHRLQAAFTNDLTKIAPGSRAVHAPARRGRRLGARRHHRVVGARRGVRRDAQRLQHRRSPCRHRRGGDHARPCRAGHAGPARQGASGGVFPSAAEVGRFRVEELSWQGAHCTVAGTGYTGEAGVEIAVPVAAATDLWSRWSVRASCPRVWVLATRCAWRRACRCTATSWAKASPHAGRPRLGGRLGKDEFRGRGRWRPNATAACIECCAASPPKAVARHAPTAPCSSTASIGVVTSGNFSPVLEHGIALAFLPPAVEEGTEVSIDVRGSACWPAASCRAVRRQALSCSLRSSTRR
jgi:aminomethyltransferase